MPSFRSEPKAMYSASAQSTVLFFTISPRVFKIRLSPERRGAQQPPAPRDSSLAEGEAASGCTTPFPRLRGEDPAPCWRERPQVGAAWLPPWMVKFSTGTELATFPMCVRTSSVKPVEGQDMLLGCPSRVKKPRTGGPSDALPRERALTAHESLGVGSDFRARRVTGGQEFVRDAPPLTRPRGVQPVLDVQDLLVLGPGEGLLADLVVLGDLLLQGGRGGSQGGSARSPVPQELRASGSFSPLAAEAAPTPAPPTSVRGGATGGSARPALNASTSPSKTDQTHRIPTQLDLPMPLAQNTGRPARKRTPRPPPRATVLRPHHFRGTPQVPEPSETLCSEMPYL